MIYCTDCHASNGQGSPAGPHGSMYPQILKYNYDRSANFVDNRSAYELCYQCHDQSATTNSHNAFSGSQTHGRLTSCNTCHDPHGVSASQGNIVNNSYLINFTNIVTKNSLGVLNYTKNSPGHGACNLSCHKHDHINSIY